MYDYKTLKPKIYSDDGQRLLLKVRDFVHNTLMQSGAIRMQEIVKASGHGDSYIAMACVDRLFELGEIREIERAANIQEQHRIFVSNR